MTNRFVYFREPVTNKLPNDKLDEMLKQLGSKLEEEFGCTVRHRMSGGTYKIVGPTMMHYNNRTYYGVVYAPEELADDLFNLVVHTRPVHEFIDGRFVSA